MPYSESLADQIRDYFAQQMVTFEEKKMMGGLVFMVDDKMCVGVGKDGLMARIDPEIYDEVVLRPEARPMDFTRKPMRGFVFVDVSKADLEYWLDLALEFNPRAKSSKKKK